MLWAFISFGLSYFLHRGRTYMIEQSDEKYEDDLHFHEHSLANLLSTCNKLRDQIRFKEKINAVDFDQSDVDDINKKSQKEEMKIQLLQQEYDKYKEVYDEKKREEEEEERRRRRRRRNSSSLYSSSSSSWSSGSSWGGGGGSSWGGGGGGFSGGGSSGSW